MIKSGKVWFPLRTFTLFQQCYHNFHGTQFVLITVSFEGKRISKIAPFSFWAILWAFFWCIKHFSSPSISRVKMFFVKLVLFKVEILMCIFQITWSTSIPEGWYRCRLNGNFLLYLMIQNSYRQLLVLT